MSDSTDGNSDDGMVPGARNGRIKPPWKKGCASPNPKGAPTTSVELRDMCRALTPEAIKTAAKLMRKAKTERVQLLATETILDRGYGKPKQSILHEFEQYTNEQLLGILVGRAASGGDNTGQSGGEAAGGASD